MEQNQPSTPEPQKVEPEGNSGADDIEKSEKDDDNDDDDDKEKPSFSDYDYGDYQIIMGIKGSKKDDMTMKELLKQIAHGLKMQGLQAIHAEIEKSGKGILSMEKNDLESGIKGKFYNPNKMQKYRSGTCCPRRDI